MSLFPRALGSPNLPSSFTPFFQFLDDFDTYSRQLDGGRPLGSRGRFNPNFDVRELPDSYHLNGELPGVERDDLQIEFTDPQTLIIRGHTERSYASATPATGLLTEPSASGAITEDPKGSTTQIAAKDKESTSKDNTTAVTVPDKAQHTPAKYWVSERSYGEFARTFSFPSSVDQDHVQASLKNGVLDIVVPKTCKPEGRKITIS